jgi:hypothetical protein
MPSAHFSKFTNGDKNRIRGTIQQIYCVRNWYDPRIRYGYQRVFKLIKSAIHFSSYYPSVNSGKPETRLIIKKVFEMKLQSINPYSGEIIQEFEPYSAIQVEKSILDSADAFKNWKKTSFETRKQKMLAVSELLEKNAVLYAKIISEEMGKPLSVAELEVKNGILNVKDRNRPFHFYLPDLKE